MNFTLYLVRRDGGTLILQLLKVVMGLFFLFSLFLQATCVHSIVKRAVIVKVGVLSLGQEDPLEVEMATHSSILA